MSKFNKFVDHPNWFFRDAFKKRESKVANKLKSINDQLKKIGIPVQLDIQIIEQSFVDAATKLSHDNRISQQIVKIVASGRKNNIKLVNSETPVLQKLKSINIGKFTPYITIKHSFEISISPSNPILKDVRGTENKVKDSNSHILSNVSTTAALENTLPVTFPARAKQLFSLLNPLN